MFEIVLVALAALLFAAGLAYVLREWVRTFFKYRGKRIVTCPETNETVGVDVDAVHAAATAPFGGGPDLRLKSCTRWPERAPCGQECLAQIEAAPEQCSVKSILGDWYAGTTCVLCRAPIGELRWADHKPAFLAPDGKPVAWSDVAPEILPDVLSTHRRICWNCYISESFRAEHPDLVVEDPRPALRPPGDPS